MGYLAVLGMLGLAVTGLMIPSDLAVIGWFGPIHIFSIFTFWGVGEGLWYIWQRNIAAHRKAMQGVFFGAVGLAGVMTFLPGRTMNRVLFGEATWLGWVFCAVGAALVIWVWLRWRARKTVIA